MASYPSVVSTRERWYIWSRIRSEERSPFSFHCFVQVILILYTVQDGHSVFLRPGHDLRSSFLLEKAVSEKCFIAVLGEVHLHCWSFIVVRHGGHVHRDVFCFLFLRLETLIPSRTCSSLPSMSHLIQYPGYHGDTIIRASIALGPSEGVSLMHTHSSR